MLPTNYHSHTIIDCTIRDGGYYTNWLFEDDFLFAYLNLCDLLSIDYVDIGLRSLYAQSYRGKFAYSPTTLLHELFHAYPNLKFSVLINFSEASEWSANDLNRLFPVNDYKSLIRIAVKPNAYNETAPLIGFLTDRGYTISLNIQNFPTTIEYYTHVIAYAKSINLSLLYLADSRGSVLPSQVQDIVSYVANSSLCPLGVHMHDNMSLAFANTITAYNSGATFLDSTFMGIGRGSGNCPTEYLCSFLKSLSPTILHQIQIFLDQFIVPLRQTHHWGSTLPYFISGKNMLPGSFLHSILQTRSYSLSSLFDIVDPAFPFSDSILNPPSPVSSVLLERSNYLKVDFTSIIFGNGTGWMNDKGPIIKLASSPSLIAASVNCLSSLHMLPFLKYFFSCDPIRIIELSNSQLPEHSSVVCPSFYRHLFHDPGLLHPSYECIVDTQFSISRHSCSIPFLQSFVYSLCFLYSLGHRNILVAGIEGYSRPSHNTELLLSLAVLQQNLPDLNLLSLHSNSLGIPSVSPYELLGSL